MLFDSSVVVVVVVSSSGVATSFVAFPFWSAVLATGVSLRCKDSETNELASIDREKKD